MGQGSATPAVGTGSRSRGSAAEMSSCRPIRRPSGPGTRAPRLIAELPCGTSIWSLAVTCANNGSPLIAVSGPGVAVAEVRAAEEIAS
jgi:hypothetical protein